MKNSNNTNYKVRSFLVAAAIVLLILPKFMDNYRPQENDTQTQETTAQETVTQVQEATRGQEAAKDADTTPTTITFRSRKSCEEHYEKHGIEMGFSTPEEYEQAAAAVVLNADSLHKLEEEDGDDVYYLEKTNEFVIVSTDGYIRTYFYPSDGIDYFNRQ